MSVKSGIVHMIQFDSSRSIYVRLWTLIKTKTAPKSALIIQSELAAKTCNWWQVRDIWQVLILSHRNN